MEECAKAEVPEPFFELTMGGVDVRFSPKVMQEMSVETTQKSTVKGTVKSTVKILALMSQDAEITIPEIAEALGISTRAVEKHISKLKAENKLERIGADKGGYWKIITKKEIN